MTSKKDVIKAARKVYQKDYCKKCYGADAPLCNALDAYDQERVERKAKRKAERGEQVRFKICLTCGQTLTTGEHICQ